MVLKVQFAFHAWCNLLPGGWACIPVAVPSSSLLALVSSTSRGCKKRRAWASPPQQGHAGYPYRYCCLLSTPGGAFWCRQDVFFTFFLSCHPLHTSLRHSIPLDKAQLTRTE